MKAIILAGGFGTRLKSVVSDVPKPLADINGKPFLKYLLESLEKYNLDAYIISIGYMGEKIIEALGDNHKGVAIKYVKEDTPLGTGGAIKFATDNYVEDDENVVILNGDTFLAVPIDEMVSHADGVKSNLMLAAKFMENCYRYGTISFEEDIIKEFNDAGDDSSGWINGGVYLLKPRIFNEYDFGEKFSFEKDILINYARNSHLFMHRTEKYFIDIGIPEDYERAHNELGAHIND